MQQQCYCHGFNQSFWWIREYDVTPAYSCHDLPPKVITCSVFAHGAGGVVKYFQFHVVVHADMMKAFYFFREIIEQCQQCPSFLDLHVHASNLHAVFVCD